VSESGRDPRVVAPTNFASSPIPIYREGLVASAIRQAVFRSRCIRRRAQRATAYSRLIFGQHTQRLSVAQQQDQPGEPVGVRILEPNFRGRNRVGGNRAPNLVPALRPRFPSPSGAAPHPFWDPWHCASGVRTEPRASWLSVPSAVPSGQPSGLRSVARKDGTPQPSAILRHATDAGFSNDGRQGCEVAHPVLSGTPVNPGPPRRRAREAPVRVGLAHTWAGSAIGTVAG
jgi:hypothetical protein